MKSSILRVETVKGDKYEKYLLKCKKELDKWFGVSVNIPRVLFVQSRKEYNKIMGFKTEAWQVGNSENGVIYILDPKIYTKESDNKDIKRFWLVLKHEYVHLYWHQITKAWNPRWLNEGLACYLAGQEKKTPSQEVVIDVQEYFSHGGMFVYGLGYFWVNYLVKKFGKTKLLNLIKSVDADITAKKFEVKFKRIYGFGLDKKSLKGRIGSKQGFS